MMLNDDIRPNSLDGIKRLATQIKKDSGVQHCAALNLAARAASYSNYAEARRKLRRGHDVLRATCRLFLTVYWQDSDARALGRETLEISLSKSLQELCSRSEMKQLRGLGWMREAADDHLVSDDVASSESAARELICKGVRALRFIEGTGLRPTRRRLPDELEKLPGSDHPTIWYDREQDQIVMIDEPYGGDPDDARRLEWADTHDWHLRLSRWPGMYFPPHCNMFVATSADKGYDFDALMAKIDSLPPPVRQEHWEGISAPTHDVFVSPAAKSPQARRRAKAQGTVIRRRTQWTVPYQVVFGSRRRKPAGKPGISTHVSAGEIIKAVLHGSTASYGVKARLNSLRCTLEDWLGMEISRDELPGPEFFDVYYHEADSTGPAWMYAQSPEGTIKLLQELKTILVSNYPECAPLRSQISKIERCIALVRAKLIRS